MPTLTLPTADFPCKPWIPPTYPFARCSFAAMGSKLTDATNMSLGLSLVNFGKILKCAGNEDTVTLKHDDGTDNLSLMFESSNNERISDFEMKLWTLTANTWAFQTPNTSALSECHRRSSSELPVTFPSLATPHHRRHQRGRSVLRERRHRCRQRHLPPKRKR